MKRAKAGDSKSKSKAVVDSTSDKNGAEAAGSKGKKAKKPAKPKVVRTPAQEAKAAAFRKMVSRGKPKNLGEKKVPKGAPNCFADQAFVLTGVCESFERNTLKAIVEKYGGRIVSAISKKVNYLIVGRDAGDSKLSKAEELGITQIDEDQFLDLIRQSSGSNEKEDDSDEEEGEENEDEEEGEENEDEEEGEENEDEDEDAFLKSLQKSNKKRRAEQEDDDDEDDE